MYIRNAWYVAAWEHEVGREMMRRILLDEPVVLFRRDDGTPVALEDRCCHRRAPLSEGKLIGNIVQCPYHGLQFDETGACVRVPSQKQIPPGARVKSYPVVERNHWIWIWMGDPAKADPDLIEDFHWMDDPDWRFGGDRLRLEGNYLLLVENLLDTTHSAVHPSDDARHRRVRRLGGRDQAREGPRPRQPLAAGQPAARRSTSAWAASPTG